MKPMIIGAAGCLVQYKGLILVVKDKKSNKWCLPAGKPLERESIEETAIRETFEETGLKVKTNRLLHIFTKPQPFYLFEGLLLPENIKPPLILSVPTEFQDEIAEAGFKDFKAMESKIFRYPEALPVIYKLVDQITILH